MGVSFIRRFTQDPGNAILLEIESVNVLDLTPPASITGVGTGTAHLVGEMEDGPFNVTTQILDASDLTATFGGFGYTVGSTPAQNPCAVQRSADAAIVPEYWNGNGALALNGKQFASLLVTRVNTSVGSVVFTPLAWIESTTALTSYPLVTGQTLVLSADGTPVTATFTGTAATVTGVAGTFAPTAGELLVLGWDAAPNFTTIFQGTEVTVAAVVARINQYAGFTFATVSSSQIKLTGIQGGTGGQVRVIAGAAATALGLTAATTAGTGNVANIAAVAFAEVSTIVKAAGVTASETLNVELDPANGFIRLSNTETPGTGTLSVTSCSAAGLGFVAGTASNAANTPVTVLPAGTVVQNSGATIVLLTMQSTQYGSATAGSGGVAITVPVRFANDNGSGVGTASTGVIVVVPNPPPTGAVSVTNITAIANALTEAQLDAQYAITLAAGGPTTDINTVAKTTNIIWAARHSNAVRSALRTNALYASANGCYGRVAPVTAPLNTLPATAIAMAPATASDRVFFCYVGWNVFVPQIALLGLAGGPGFTATGNVNLTSDGVLASVLSQLAPEENPGQLTSFTSAANGIETSPNVQGFDIQTYIAFKAAGIIAGRWDADDGAFIFQSGVTSVNPLTSPGLVNISRRRMADFIQDSVANFAAGYGKKLATNLRKVALMAAVTKFLNGLLSPDNPGQQRIAGYSPAANVGNANTPPNMFRFSVNVQTLDSLDSIVPVTLIGDSVNVTVLPQAGPLPQAA